MEGMQQYAYELDELNMTRVLHTLGLVKQPTPLDGGRLRRILLPAIEQTLERKPEHQIEHWGNRGWWYHGQLEEQEWVLLKLKFFK